MKKFSGNFLGNKVFVVDKWVGGNEILRYNDNVEMSVSTAPPDEHLVPGRWCGWLVY